jgi:hypothetical protein
MSLSPGDRPQHYAGDGGPVQTATSAVAPPEAPMNRATRLWTICFILLALEIGGFLAVFPWIDAWRINNFRSFFPSMAPLWDDPYFRGAITGLGITNLLVALGQSVYLIRSLRKPRY